MPAHTPLTLVIKDVASMTHHLTAQVEHADGHVLIRRATISRRRILPLLPVRDIVIDEQAYFSLRHLLAAVEVIREPLEPTRRLLGFPLMYRDEVRVLHAQDDTVLRLVVSYRSQHLLHAFFCRCFARLYESP